MLNTYQNVFIHDSKINVDYKVMQLSLQLCEDVL